MLDPLGDRLARANERPPIASIFGSENLHLFCIYFDLYLHLYLQLLGIASESNNILTEHWI